LTTAVRERAGDARSVAPLPKDSSAWNVTSPRVISSRHPPTPTMTSFRRRPQTSCTKRLRAPIPSAAGGLQAAVPRPYCYSPRGTSPLAEKSRHLRDLIKRADSAMLAHCVTHIATIIDAGTVRDFLRPDLVLVPVPRRVAYDLRDPRSAPEAIARALHAAGHGKIVWPALRRVRTIPKSAWSRAGSRPEFLEHYTSLELIDHEPPARRLLLVDDFVTRGRTLLAAAAVLRQAVPSAHLRAFALVRTEGLVPDIAAITAPTIGTIRYLGGDAFRSP
jgi:predicted amidophosphoribosyltransferase